MTPKLTAKPQTLRIGMLVIAIIMTVLMTVSVMLKIFAGNQTVIFEPMQADSSAQNTTILFNNKNQLCFIGTQQNEAQAIDGNTGNLLWTFAAQGAVNSLCYDEGRDLLYAGSQDRNVYVLKGKTGELQSTFTLKGKIYDMDLDPDKQWLLVSHGTKANKHWLSILDANTGKTGGEISLTSTARSSCFAKDRTNILYGDARGRLYLINLQNDLIAENRMKGDIRSINVVGSNGDVIVQDDSGYVGRFDANLNQQWLKKFEGNGRAVDVSEDGKWIVAVTREGDIHIINADGSLAHSYRQKDIGSFVYYNNGYFNVTTMSANLFHFSVDDLDNLASMKLINEKGIWFIVAFAVLAFAFYVAAFPGSRRVAESFFYSLGKHKTAYIMLLPSLALIGVFSYYNVFQAFYYAFTDWSNATQTMREVNFIGFDNFVKMFTEGYFLLGVKNLLILMGTSFIKLLTIPIILAELVFAMRSRKRESSKRRYWFRVLLVLPMIVPGVVSTLMWKNIYDPNVGALNALLKAVGRPDLAHSWLGDPATAIWAIVFMGFPWVNSFAFLVFYGGLINIPGDLFEAAKIDGSNAFWNFFKIHLPLITPQLKMLIITTFIGTVQDYGGILLLTSGGPGTSTYVPGLELYFAATKFGQYGYACAMGVVLFIVILIGSLLNLRIKTQEVN